MYYQIFKSGMIYQKIVSNKMIRKIIISIIIILLKSKE